MCGPSGAGKSSLINKLREEFPDDFGFSVSHTTRKPRPGERDGVDYHFIDVDEMKAAIARGGEFIETAVVHTNMYGTSVKAVDDVAAKHRVCVLDIDVQGVKSCKAANFGAGKYVFIAPPSVDELRRRLVARGTETEESLRTRLTNAKGEIEAAKTIDFDSTVVNDDLDRAYVELRATVLPLIESCRACRQKHGDGASAGAGAAAR